MQADATDRAVVAQAILGLLCVISGKDHGDVPVVELGGAGGVDTSGEEPLGVAHHRGAGGDGDLRSPSSGRRNALGVDVNSSRESRSDGVINSVDHRPVNQVYRFRVADVVERVRVGIDAVAAGEEQSEAAAFQ